MTTIPSEFTQFVSMLNLPPWPHWRVLTFRWLAPSSTVFWAAPAVQATHLDRARHAR
jgi:hypothetical protein